MIYLVIISIVVLSIFDIKDMKAKNYKRDIYVYIVFMLLVGILGIYYYSNTERDSFSEVLLSLIGREG